MKTLTLWIVLGLVTMLNVPIAAVTVTDLYSVIVPLVERADSKTALNEAFRQALLQVLIKLNGHRKEVVEALHRTKLVKPEELVQQYEYQTDTQGKRMVLVEFDESEIEDLMEELGLPRWSDSRPTLLAWIIVNQNNQARTISESESGNEASAITAQAKQRGLPILFPLLDLEDQMNLRSNAVEKGDDAAIRTAVDRYKTETILTGWILQKEGQWEGRWRLLIQEKSQNWQDKRLTLSELLNEAIHRSIDTIAQQFSSNPTETNKPTDNQPSSTAHSQMLEITVKNVPNFAEYTRLKEYLLSLGIVTQMQPQSIQMGEVTFQLTIKGGQAAFEQALNLGNTLKPLTHEKSHTMIYYLRSQ